MDALLERCRAFFDERGTDVYLVGGHVRDQALGRESHDYDFAVGRDALPLARALADRLDGAYVALDAERETGRVVLPAGVNIDIALMRGASIAEDLGARDFTINAMARRLDERAPLIDPHGGLDDLEARVVRAVAPGAFERDAVRVVRAVRLAAELGFEVEPATREQLLAARPLVGSVSRERLRDELVRMLELGHSGDALRALSLWAIMPYVLPGAIADDAAFERLGRLEQCAARLAAGSAMTDADDILRSELNGVINSGRARLTLAKAATLFVDARVAGRNLHALRFSRHEVSYASAIVRHTRRLDGAAERPTRLEAHRFFRDTGPAGLTLLAVALGADGDDAPQAMARQWLHWYRNEYERVVAPRPLIDGAALAAQFGLRGPQIGRALARLIEAQVDGRVATPDEAMHLLANISLEEDAERPSSQ